MALKETTKNPQLELHSYSVLNGVQMFIACYEIEYYKGKDGIKMNEALERRNKLMQESNDIVQFDSEDMRRAARAMQVVFNHFTMLSAQQPKNEYADSPPAATGF